MRRTSAALLIALSLAAGAAGCGRNENEGGSPDGQGESIEERKTDIGTTTTERLARPAGWVVASGRLPRGGSMDLYALVRRSGWADGAELERAAARSTEEGDKEGSGVRWIRSYVTAEEDGRVGTFCIYQADRPEAIRAHARAADLPVDEVVKIADTVIVRPDPQEAHA